MTKRRFFKEDFNLFWEFVKLPLESTLSDFRTKQLEPVTLPHDWLIYDTENLYESSTGWYKKEFELQPTSDSLYYIYFDGIYMESTIYINGHVAGEWKNGYAAFEVDITPHIISGINTIIVQVIHQSPNSRWYSGAGIYRDVYLIQRDLNHIPLDGNYISIRKKSGFYQIEVETELNIDGEFLLQYELFDGNFLIESRESITDKSLVTTVLSVKPILWDIDNPKLYRFVTTLKRDNEVYQELEYKIGFKDISFSSSEGLFLNGKHLKINGVCEHHDLGCLGAAFNRTVMKNRLFKLKEMGVNAIRTAHTIPAKELLELTDELGFLLVNEAYDMWERPKTEFDYHRYFLENLETDVKNWIRRDRNHVSLLMWSIGNEIYDTHVDERGLELTKLLRDEVLKHDPKGNGVITLGSNFMPWENAQKCANELKFAGYNYAERVYDEHHKRYPDWYIYGSETASIVQSRGIYHFPLEASILVEDDKQCSALGNSVTSWGAKSIEDVITIDSDLPFSLGQFIWTGFDYIGEPTPYTTKNAYFGQIDTAGFEKDSYYVYKSAWGNEPVLHIYPYWLFNEGQIIDVRVATNLPLVKLYLNDQLIGEKSGIVPSFKVPFTKGELRAEGYDRDGNLILTSTRNSFGLTSKLKVSADKFRLDADGKDVTEITIEVVDDNNRIVEDCRIPVEVEISGVGVLLGMDNGDSTDFSPYKTGKRQLFQGKVKAFVGSTLESGPVTVKVKSFSLQEVEITLDSIDVDLSSEQKVAKQMNHFIRSGEISSVDNIRVEYTPIDRIELINHSGTSKIEDRKSRFIEVVLHPPNVTLRDIKWVVTTDLGVISNIAELEPVSNGCNLRALGDGSFRLKCMAHNGKSHADIISQLEFSVSGLGEAYKNPYEFISAGLYDDVIGEIGAGNERGIATDNLGKSGVVFNSIDFGSFGSDIITLPIFDFESRPLDIELYLGHPENGELLDILKYDKKTIWDVYQEESYRLSKRLKGVQTLSILFNTRVHLKGFQFKPLKKGYEQLSILECDSYYGDSFQREEWGFRNIGNNVSFLFDNMDIDKVVKSIEICGRSLTEKNSIRIQTTGEEGSNNQIVEFVKSDGFITRQFTLDPLNKVDTVEFIFLPGSQFDFKWFRFLKDH